MKITYEQVAALHPCYQEKRLHTLLPEGEHEVTLNKLLQLPKSDARWLVIRLLTKQNLIIWAKACTRRADTYAAYVAAHAAADARAAADAAAHAAAYAEDTAIYVEDAARYALYAAGAAADAATHAARYAEDAARSAALTTTLATAAEYAEDAVYNIVATEHKLAMEHAIELFEGV